MVRALAGYNRQFRITLFSIGLIIFSPSHGFADDLTRDELFPLQFKAIYEGHFGGIRVGKMGLEIEQTDKHYAMTSDIVSTGLLRMFVQHSSHTTVDATGRDFTYSDVEYETHYQTRKKKKSAMLLYKQDKVIEENVTPPDNRATRPAVEASLKNASVDPLSLLLKMRKATFDAWKENRNEFSISIYDGRRLTEIQFTMQGEKEIPYFKNRASTVVVQAKRKLIAGFTPSELDDYDKDEPPLYVYFSRDKKFMPLRIEAQLWAGTLSAVLAKECAPNESCLLGIRE